MKRLPTIILALLLTGTAARAWDIPGHMVVAKIAYERLNPRARAKVDELAPKMTFNGHHYNPINVAGWADNVKHSTGDPFSGHFQNWHFIDLGCDAGDPDPLANPPKLSTKNGDVVIALQHCEKVIRGGTDPLIPSEQVAVALMIHLVGDIHQPLHCTANYYTQAAVEPGHRAPTHAEHDHGGNGVIISNFPDKYPNLHSFWDQAYKAKYNPDGKVTTTPDWPTFETDRNSPKLLATVAEVLKFKPATGVSLAADYAAWARETHSRGCKTGYGALHQDFEHRTVKLTSTYVKNAQKAAKEQLCLAGYRLAELLNGLYPEH